MKLSSTKIDSKLLSIGLLFIRISFGTLMIVNHGWMKIIKFETLKLNFFNFLGMGSQISLTLAIIAEILCSILLIFGLYTRVALIPLIITMIVAASAHSLEIFGDAELAFMYLIVFIFLLIVGPGAKSIDARMNKKSFY